MAEETKSKKPRLNNDITDLSPSVSANFPNEIWLKIFEFLPTYDILRKMAFVNKHFNDLSKHPKLIKEIYLNIDILDYDKAKEAYETIQRSKSLLKMTIFHHSDNWDFPPGLFISIMIKSCPKLCSLKFDLKKKVLSKDSSRNVLRNLGIDKNKSFDEIKLQDKAECEKGFRMLNFGIEFENEFVVNIRHLRIPNGHYKYHNLFRRYIREFIDYEINEIYLRAILIHLKNIDCFDISSFGEISNLSFEFFFSERAISVKSLKLNISQARALTPDLMGCLQNLNELEVGHQISRHASALSMLPNLRKLIIFYTGMLNIPNVFENVKFENLEWLKGDGTEFLGSHICRSLIEKMVKNQKTISFGNCSVSGF